ncbi:MAG: family 78 glycoside hydrolase catalytic domain [Clostridia bacterium]|nr:family 78 glycoside hydrolase catalytic domain [Clostridia bacterium]
MVFPKNFVYAGPEYAEYDKFVPSPYFRKTFEIDDPALPCRVVVTGLGFYRVWINGKEITKGLLAPYISNPDDIVYFDEYDLSPYIIKGKNVLGFQLGNGMQNAPGGQVWDFDIARFRGAPRLAFALTTGETVAEADGSVKTSPSPLYFDDIRSGARYDARREIAGWNLPDFDDSAWKNALPCESPRGEFRLCEAEPIRPTGRVLPPVSVVPAKGRAAHGPIRKVPAIADPDGAPTADGGLLFDFGENNTGYVRLKINGRPGQKLSLLFAEVAKDGVIDSSNIDCFYPDGHAQRDIYICKGGAEGWEPCFTYHGFRYCLVTGVEEGQEFSLEFVVCTSQIPSIASFRCSDETANTLYGMAERSDRSNFWYFPTDCPHREKNGWTGDAALSAEHMLLTMDCENSLREWMRNIRAGQRHDGCISGITPTAAGWGFDLGPSWDTVLTMIPYYSYIYTGDRTILEENADAILAYLHYASRKQKPDGLVEYGLGDWCPVGSNSTMKPSREYTNSLSLMVMAEQASFIFGVLNMKKEKTYADALYLSLRDGLRDKYVDESGTVADDGYQTSQAMAIFYGLFKTGKMDAAKRMLIDEIHKNDDFLDVGILGARVLFRVLADAGEADLAYKMITRREFPSYGRFIDAGLTTLPECFEIGFPGAEAGSYNHHMFGDIKAWFISCVAGLNVNPERSDPNHIQVKPNFISALSFAEAAYRAPAGEVRVRWERTGECVDLSVSLPDGVTAEVVFPDGTRTAQTGTRTYKF